MVTRKNTRNAGRKQGGEQHTHDGSTRRVRITADTPYGECSERLTAFGGLLALVKFVDLIRFEEAFAQHYVPPARAAKLGGYRVVLGLLMLLFIGFQRLGQFAYVRTDAMVCGILRVSVLPAVSTFWRYLPSMGINQSASLLRLSAALRAQVWAGCGCGCAGTASSSDGRARRPVWTRDSASFSATSAATRRFWTAGGMATGSTSTTSACINPWDGNSPAGLWRCGYAKTRWANGS